MARLPKITPNPVYEYMRHLHSISIKGLPVWTDDIIMGACYTCVGASKGKLNVNPALVKAAVFLPIISTEACMNIYTFEPISQRTARAVAQAARFAVAGIQMYLERTPRNLEEYYMERDFIAAYKKESSPLYSEKKAIVPQEILELYTQGKYLEYGQALQAYRITVG